MVQVSKFRIHWFIAAVFFLGSAFPVLTFGQDGKLLNSDDQVVAANRMLVISPSNGGTTITLFARSPAGHRGYPTVLVRHTFPIGLNVVISYLVLAMTATTWVVTIVLRQLRRRRLGGLDSARMIER